MFDRNGQQSNAIENSLQVDNRHWSMRFLHWLDNRFRPSLGWGVLGLVALLLLSFNYTAYQSRWLDSPDGQRNLAALVVWAVLVGWWLYGWHQDRAAGRFLPVRLLAAGFAYLLLGIALVSQFVAGWLPSIAALFDALRSWNFNPLAAQLLQNIDRLTARLLLWWQILQADEPVRDDLVLSLILAVVLWLLAGVTVWLVRRTKVGLLAAAPTVAINIALLYWGRESRSAILVTLGVALLLHLWLHHKTMQQRWDRLNLDYSASIVIDRLLSAFGAGMLIIILAAILPNLYIRPLALWYWQLMSPNSERINEFRQQLLPDFTSSTRWRSGVGRGGLPNEFILGAGPEELGTMLVMYVRTNESAAGYDQEPPGNYMRALTLAQYDGKGWRNPDGHELQELPANQRWMGGERSGRRLLVQSVETRVDSPMLFAAGEPIEASVDAEVEWLPNGELIGFRSWERRYTVVSSVPAVGNQTLNAVGDWGGDNRMPLGAQLYMQLPDTVTPRVRDLAGQLTITATSLFEKATSIEQYLRQFPYDLTVPEPPLEVKDVADYFLFDLQRGYCDYYATAFVVLARSAGIPARMATGYAVGSWDFSDMQWVVTEAQAHSWPEVFFPQYGWIPFEPTAGRANLTRIDQFSSSVQSTGSAQATMALPEENSERWNWQMLFWVLPLAAVVGGIFVLARRFWAARHDPWQTLLRWGARRGRPMNSGDTILEYGDALAQIFENQAERVPGRDGLRSTAREVTEISEAVSEVRYATEAQRSNAVNQIDKRWLRIKDYIQ